MRSATANPENEFAATSRDRERDVRRGSDHLGANTTLLLPGTTTTVCSSGFPLIFVRTLYFPTTTFIFTGAVPTLLFPRNTSTATLVGGNHTRNSAVGSAL